MDSKYQKIGEGLAKSCPPVSFGVIQDAGHRVPWENPNEFVQALGKFMNL
jgi:pimeloyl-ACP methyl ester carboxylesterase